jgi:hypothetical protein
MLFFANKTLTRRRFVSQTMPYGKATTGGYTDAPVAAGVQPASAQQLALLEEGKRNKINYVVISEDELNLPTSTTRADWLQIDGMWFEVSIKDPCTSGVLEHFEYVVTKIENPQDF